MNLINDEVILDGWIWINALLSWHEGYQSLGGIFILRKVGPKSIGTIQNGQVQGRDNPLSTMWKNDKECDNKSVDGTQNNLSRKKEDMLRKTNIIWYHCFLWTHPLFENK